MTKVIFQAGHLKLFSSLYKPILTFAYTTEITSDFVV